MEKGGPTANFAGSGEDAAVVAEGAVADAGHGLVPHFLHRTPAFLQLTLDVPTRYHS